VIPKTRTILQRAARILYFVFCFAVARSKSSLTLNSTILLIRSKGIGLSNGNFSEPFSP
jgi:hypothetical protein